MKAILCVIGIMIFLFFSNNQQEKVTEGKPKAEIKQNTDSVEYELIVFDIGFESYLAKIPYTKDYYSNEYLNNWNLRYVTEWNNRVLNPVRYGSFYETQIDYRPNIDYGLDLNFKLYHYFQFIEMEHGITLVKRK